MSTLTISLPDTIRRRVEDLAREDGVPLDHFIASTLSQRAAVADADSYIRRRARHGSPERLEALLAAAPDTPPDEADKLD